jgi:outer membrane biosynthesis protein TonB
MTDNDPIAPTSRGPSWRFILASAVGSLVVHLLVASAIYVEFTHPARPAADRPPLEVAVVSPDMLPKPPAKEQPKPEPPKPQAKEQPKPPEPPKAEPPKPEPPKPQAEKPKPPPFKADPSQVVPATRDKATGPQGNQAAPTTAQRQSDTPDKPDSQSAAKAPPTPDADKVKPDEPQQTDAKPPEDPKPPENPKPEEPQKAEDKPPEAPKPADPNGILPPPPAKPAPSKPTQTATLPHKPPPSKTDGGGRRQVMAPVVVRPDAVNGRAGNSAIPSYPSAARANGLQGRVVL